MCQAPLSSLPIIHMMIARWTLPVALEYDARIWRRKRALVTWTSRYVASGVCSAPPISKATVTLRLSESATSRKAVWRTWARGSRWGSARGSVARAQAERAGDVEAGRVRTDVLNE